MSLATANNMALLMNHNQASVHFFQHGARVLQPNLRRHQSTYKRSRSRLNVKPDASFLPSKTETHDHIIFNPPPSMPNVYHTPTIFLPKNDRRRQMIANSSSSSSSTQLSTGSMSGSPSSSELAPAIRERQEKRYHVTPDQMAEIRQLRRQDPYEWSVTKLAKKFDCSRIFVEYIVAGLAPQKAAEQKMVTDVVKSRWGPKRRIAREDRALRKERWLRDA